MYPVISLDDVGITFGAQRVLAGIHLAIEKGQTVAIIGESGCGKTVLLKLIIGLLRPTQGTVRFDGKILVDLPDRELAKERLRFGFLFQAAALFDSLTIFDNVAFGLRAHAKVPDEQIRDLVRARLREVGLPPSVESKKPAELSGGMKKRVGLARALVLEPEVMLYDEPTTGLDPIVSDVINQLIVQTREKHRQVTSLVVTHDMTTVRRVADRVVMLYPLSRLKSGEGQMIFDGSLAELDACPDLRVQQFVRGEARDRIVEMAG